LTERVCCEEEGSIDAHETAGVCIVWACAPAVRLRCCAGSLLRLPDLRGMHWCERDELVVPLDHRQRVRPEVHLYARSHRGYSPYGLPQG